MKRLLVSLGGGIAFALAFAVPHAGAAPCSTADVEFTIGASTFLPSTCANNIANGNPYEETDNMEIELSEPGLQFAAKTQGADAPEFSGIDFSLTAEDLDTSGILTLTWAEAPGDPDLPTTLDFALGLFGGNNGAAYFWEDILFPIAPDMGEFAYTIAFLNPGGNTPDLSHATFAVRDGGSNGGNGGNGDEVPEASALALFGVGLVGLAAAARRRRNA